jgi:hypothetical protein
VAEPQDLLAEVQRDIADLESQLTELRIVERWLAGRPARNGKAPQAALPTSPARSEPQLKEANKAYLRMTVREAAVDVLRKAAMPLKTREITEALLRGGYPTANPETMHSTVFSTLDREVTIFTKVAPGLWALADNKEVEEEGEEEEEVVND